MTRRNSVLASQETVFALQQEVFKTEQHLVQVRARLEKALEAHRQQIRQSLGSPDPRERGMAESVAVFYEVRPHTSEGA